MTILLFILFGLFSILLIVIGVAVKNQLHPTPLKTPLLIGKHKEIGRLIAYFLIGAGIAELLWTVIGYLLYDLLIVKIFITIYIALLLITSLIAAIVIMKHQR